MARYTVRQAQKKTKRKSTVTPEEQQQGSARLLAFTQGAQTRLEERPFSPSVRAHEDEAVQGFKDWQNVSAARREVEPSGQFSFLSTPEGKKTFTPTINEEANKRFNETTAQANKLGTGAKWEDFSDEQKSRVLSGLSKFGINEESATKAFSSQVSQGLSRIEKLGTSSPASFYHSTGYRADSTPKPRQQIMDTAKGANVPYHVAATAHAMLSPQLPFEQYNKRGWQPHNDDAARHALILAKSGVDLNDITTNSLKHLHANARNAEKMKETVHVTRQLLAGKGLDEVRTRKNEDPFGDKTGAFLHAWLDPNHPDPRTTIDTHTVMGFAPHLNKTQDEHTKALSVTGAHAFFDHVGKNVMKKHGLKNTHWTQALQWAEQRIHAGETTEHEAYLKPHILTPDTFSQASLPGMKKVK